MMGKEKITIDLLTKDTSSNIMSFVTAINKTHNLTALVQKELKDGYYVISVSTL